MTDWADQAVQRYKTEETDRQIKDKKSLMLRHLTQLHAEPFWHEVRRIVRENCEAFNQKLGHDLLTIIPTEDSELKVHADVGGVRGDLRAALDPVTFSISYMARCGSWSWQPHLLDDGSFAYGFMVNQVSATTAAKMASEMLDALLNA